LFNIFNFHNKTISNSNQLYKNRGTGDDLGHSLIEHDLKTIYVYSYTNYTDNIPKLKHMFFLSMVVYFFPTRMEIHFVESTQKYAIFCCMYCFRQNRQMHIHNIINLRYLLIIYRSLNYYNITMIEDNAFNNLPNLEYHLVWYVQMHSEIMSIHVIVNVL
jgi:hypothetical protein